MNPGEQVIKLTNETHDGAKYFGLGLGKRHITHICL